MPTNAMLNFLAQAHAEPVLLLSVVKPILFALVLGGWAWVVGFLDKDLAFYYLPRLMWNAIQIGCGALGFGLWLLLPIFWLGLPVALIVLSGGIVGYAFFRNAQVPPESQWSLSIDSFKHKIEERQHAAAQKHANLHLVTKDQDLMEVPTGEDPMTKAHALLESLIEFSLPRGAERFDMLVDPQKAVISVRIDGVNFPQPNAEPAVALRLIDYLKTAADMDLQDRRRKQNGLVRFQFDEKKHQLDLTTLGSTRGLTLSAVIDPVKRGMIPLEKLGLLPPQLEALQAVTKELSRCVIVTSKPRQGQTTSIYSLLREHDPYTQSIVAYEDQPSFDLEGVAQEKRPPLTDAKPASERLAALLRQDPNVFMLDQLGDAQIATMLAKNSEEIRFYFGMPQADTFSALSVWIKAVGDNRLAGTSLRALIAQRLMRKLCGTCRSPYTPDKDALRKLNLPPDRITQLFKSSGKILVGKDKTQMCPTCYGLGYRGQMAVFEVMILDDHARRLIASNELDALRAHLRKQKMLYLQEAALARVVEGATDVKEVTRALGGGE
jgi:general secretion pathway protein E